MKPVKSPIIFLFITGVLAWAILSPEDGVTQQTNQSLEKSGGNTVEQYEILKEYLVQQGRRDAVVEEVEKQFAKSFPDFTPEDYSRFMQTLDLSRDDDLWKWSHVTGIPILAVSKSSDFFYVNRHLILNVAEAEKIRSSDIKASYDETTGVLEVQTTEGREFAIRRVPQGVIRLTERTSGFSHLKNYGKDRIYFEALEPYLVRIRDLEYRDEIGPWIRALPLSVVKVYHGKGIYFTTQTGRSYAVAMPVSNTIYKVFVGLQTGVFIDPRQDGPAGTWQNFVHELGHIMDYVVIKGGYGRYRQPHQFPEFRKAQPEKELVYGKRDDKVPQTTYGYISRYSRANAQESFAEHFRAYILQREEFLYRALKEKAEGHPELMEKFRFMESLLLETSPEMVRLSSEFLAWEKDWQEDYPDHSSNFQARQYTMAETAESLTQSTEGSLVAPHVDRTGD
jgi:hypothetical protein